MIGPRRDVQECLRQGTRQGLTVDWLTPGSAIPATPPVLLSIACSPSPMVVRSLP